MVFHVHMHMHMLMMHVHVHARSVQVILAKLRERGLSDLATEIEAAQHEIASLPAT